MFWLSKAVINESSWNRESTYYKVEEECLIFKIKKIVVHEYCKTLRYQFSSYVFLIPSRSLVPLNNMLYLACTCLSPTCSMSQCMSG